MNTEQDKIYTYWSRGPEDASRWLTEAPFPTQTPPDVIEIWTDDEVLRYHRVGKPRT